MPHCLARHGDEQSHDVDIAAWRSSSDGSAGGGTVAMQQGKGKGKRNFTFLNLTHTRVHNAFPKTRSVETLGLRQGRS